MPKREQTHPEVFTDDAGRQWIEVTPQRAIILLELHGADLALGLFFQDETPIPLQHLIQQFVHVVQINAKGGTVGGPPVGKA